jgi:hypothetical protein
MAWDLRTLGIVLGTGPGDWSVVAADLVGFGGCGLLDAGKSVFGMNGRCSTLVASFVAVVASEDSCDGAGDGRPGQHGQCRLNGMP